MFPSLTVIDTDSPLGLPTTTLNKWRRDAPSSFALKVMVAAVPGEETPPEVVFTIVIPVIVPGTESSIT